MGNDIQKMEDTAKNAIKNAENPEMLEAVRIEYLGRERGVLTLILRALKELPENTRRAVGEQANRLRNELEVLFENRARELSRTYHETILRKEWIDVTHPGKKNPRGHLHPITRIIREVTDIFSSMGFSVVEGPEIETEWYNFDALNIPADHPARDMWDTFWLRNNKQFPISKSQFSNKTKILNSKSQKLLLRTHTSPVQIRYMEQHNPPIRIIVPGRVYRFEATDASHDLQFYQLEGLMVDKNISIANFKAIIQEFFSRLFGKKVGIRLRPSYFPFTEPSFEVDISCVMCAGAGCPVCKRSGWLELAGAGMVHPRVFKAAGYSPKDMRGFAFGFGLTRIAMMKYKIPDIRLMHGGDIKFLRQF